jgi:hypothetical protein
MKKTTAEKINELQEKLELYKVIEETIEYLKLEQGYKQAEDGKPYDWAEATYKATEKLIDILENL